MEWRAVSHRSIKKVEEDNLVKKQDGSVKQVDFISIPLITNIRIAPDPH